jgi:hypothetical protein
LFITVLLFFDIIMTDNNTSNSFDDVAKRVKDAWYRAERGEDVYEHHVTIIERDTRSQSCYKTLRDSDSSSVIDEDKL